MDKINLAQWNRIFGNTRQDLLFATGHYSDHRVRFDEPGLIRGSIRHVGTPGMQLIELSLQSENPFQLVDEEFNESAESVYILEGAAESRFQNL